MKKQNDEITVKGLWQIFLPKLWLIIVIGVIAGSVLGIFSSLKADTYTSSGKYMFIKINSTDENKITGVNTGEIEAMQGMIANAQEIIDTELFARKVIDGLVSKYGRTDITYEHTGLIRSMMTVTLASDDTTCYYLYATSGDSELAMQVADVAGKNLVDIYIQETKYAINITLLDDARIPTAPNDKNVKRNAVIGFAIGFILTALAVFVASRFDIIVRSREKLEETFDIPILGTIPRLEQNN